MLRNATHIIEGILRHRENRWYCAEYLFRPLHIAFRPGRSNGCQGGSHCRSPFDRFSSNDSQRVYRSNIPSVSDSRQTTKRQKGTPIGTYAPPSSRKKTTKERTSKRQKKRRIASVRNGPFFERKRNPTRTCKTRRGVSAVAGRQRRPRTVRRAEGGGGGGAGGRISFQRHSWIMRCHIRSIFGA